MKRLFLLLTALLLTGMIAGAQMVLFEDGKWAEELGTVTVQQLNSQGRTSNLRMSRDLYAITAPNHMFVYLENYINASIYKRLVVEITETSSARFDNWVGGFIMIHNETSWPRQHNGNNIKNQDHFGYWDGKSVPSPFSGKIIINFDEVTTQHVPNPDTYGLIDMDLTKLIGFSFMPGSTGRISIKKIYLE